MKLKNFKYYAALFGLTTAISLNSLSAFAKGVENEPVVEVQEDEQSNSNADIGLESVNSGDPFLEYYLESDYEYDVSNLYIVFLDGDIYITKKNKETKNLKVYDYYGLYPRYEGRYQDVIYYEYLDVFTTKHLHGFKVGITFANSSLPEDAKKKILGGLWNKLCGVGELDEKDIIPLSSIINTSKVKEGTLAKLLYDKDKFLEIINNKVTYDKNSLSIYKFEDDFLNEIQYHIGYDNGYQKMLDVTDRRVYSYPEIGTCKKYSLEKLDIEMDDTLNGLQCEDILERFKNGEISVRKEQEVKEEQTSQESQEEQEVKEEQNTQEGQEEEQNNTSVSYSFSNDGTLTIRFNCDELGLPLATQTQRYDDKDYEFINILLVENQNIKTLQICQAYDTLDFSKLNLPSNIIGVYVEFKKYNGKAVEFALNSDALLCFDILFYDSKDYKTIENLKISGANNLRSVRVNAKNYTIKDFSVGMKKEGYLSINGEIADLSVLKELDLREFIYRDKNDEEWIYDAKECSEDFKEFIADLEEERAKKDDTGYGLSFKPQN